MFRKHGGVQKLLQEKLGREILYAHSLDHQLHLVVVHAMSAETAVVDFFHVCALYKFFKKPTIAPDAHYKSVHLKHLLEQRFSGTSCLSFDITFLLTEIDSVLAYGAEIRKEGMGLMLRLMLMLMTEPSFSFIAQLLHTVLALLDPPNKHLQREDTE